MNAVAKFSLTMKMPSLGLRFLSAGGVVDVAQPILERLAIASGELVRLAIVEDDQLIYVAKAQGAKQGLRYDPEMGRPVTLSCSAGGHDLAGWQVRRRGYASGVKAGLWHTQRVRPACSTTFKVLMPLVETARQNGYATTQDMFLPAMSSMATRVLDPNGGVRAILIIAGPMSRLTEERMLELVHAPQSHRRRAFGGKRRLSDVQALLSPSSAKATISATT